jgi:type I restriction enzyme S subunit
MSIPKYDQYQPAPEDWIGELPKHWGVERIKFGLTPKASQKAPELPPGAISYGRVVTKDPEKISPETRATYQEVRAGEYLINPINLNYDLVSLRTALSGLDVCVSPAYIVLRAKPEKVVAGLGSYLLHVFDVHHMKTLGAGVRQTITFNDIGQCLWPLPPLSEQTAIVNFLDRETARIDGLIETKTRFIALLKEKVIGFADLAVTGRDDPKRALKSVEIPWSPMIPKDWDAKQGKYLFEEMARQVRADDEIITSFRDGQVCLRRKRRTGGYTFAVKEVGYQHIKKGDLVIHTMDAFAGAIGVSEDDGKATGEYAVCKPRSDDINPEYYAHLLRCMARRNYIFVLCPSVRERAPRFRFVRFAPVLLPVPPRAEQDQIVERIEQTTKRLKDLITKTTQSIDLLKEKRAALITAAVTGKIDVRGRV